MATEEKIGEETQLKDTTQGAKRRSAKLGTYLIPAALLVIFIVVIGFGFISRRKAEADLKQSTAAAAIPIVNVVYPKAGAPNNEIVLPGNTQAFTDAPIFARTNGYVKSWHVDIGTRVKKGQLLAEIETPEVDQQLQQARADLQTAQANLRQAEITADRWEALWKTNSVSKQETDVAVSAFHAMKATVDSNTSNQHFAGLCRRAATLCAGSAPGRNGIPDARRISRQNFQRHDRAKFQLHRSGVTNSACRGRCG